MTFAFDPCFRVLNRTASDSQHASCMLRKGCLFAISPWLHNSLQPRQGHTTKKESRSSAACAKRAIALPHLKAVTDSITWYILSFLLQWYSDVLKWSVGYVDISGSTRCCSENGSVNKGFPCANFSYLRQWLSEKRQKLSAGFSNKTRIERQRHARNLQLETSPILSWACLGLLKLRLQQLRHLSWLRRAIRVTWLVHHRNRETFCRRP